LAIIHKKNVEEFKNPAIFYHFSHILELGKFQILPNNKGFDGFPFSKRKKERKKERKCPIESGGMKFLIGLLPKVPFPLEIYLVLPY